MNTCRQPLLLCLLLLLQNVKCMERERHPSSSQRMSPARDSDSAQMLTKSMPVVKKLVLSGLTETSGQVSPSRAAPASPIRKTVSLGPEVLEREEEKLRRSQQISRSSPATPRHQFTLEVSELHDWATKQGDYKGSHIGITAGNRALKKTYHVDALDKEWFTPLMGAILVDDHGDNFDRVEFLIRNGAKINRICMLGLDPLQLCKPGSEAIRGLLERHAKSLGLSFAQERYGPEVTITLNQERYQELPDSIKNEISGLRNAAERVNASAEAVIAYKFFLLKCGLINGIDTVTCNVLQPKAKDLR